MWRIAFAALILATAAISTAAAQDNPTGDCGLRRDGSRAGYHFAEASSWMPDCRNPLRREYWRVLLKHDGTVYVIPRLDGDPMIRAVCAASGHELRNLVDKYSLCAPAPSAEWVRVINSMAPSDALRITRYLHERLRFQTRDNGPQWGKSVTPYPIPSDIVDACALRRSTASVKFLEKCLIETEYLSGRRGREGAWWQGDGAEELASRLNELYGIEP